MGLFDLFRVKQLQKENLELKRLDRNIAVQNLISSFNRSVAVFPSQNITKYADRYCTDDNIHSIIKLLASTAARIPFYGYTQTEDKKSLKKLLYTKSLRPQKYKELQTKALTDLPEQDPVAMLLERPNDKMGKYQFFVELYSWLYLDGEVLLRKQRPEDGNNKAKPISLTFWNPVYAIPKVSEGYPKQILAWDYRINGILIEENVPTSELIHIKYWNPETTFTGDELRGLSPIRVLARRLTSLDANLDRTVAHLQNSGVDTLIYDKSLVGISGKEAIEIMDARKDTYYRFMSNSANAGAPYFATGEMGAINVGSHLAEMGVTDLAKIDFKKLCNVYNISDRLFNNDATGSEISDDNARKGLYTIGVLPNCFMVRDALINNLLPDFSEGVLFEQNGEPVRIQGDGKKRFIDLDVSDITELNEDVSKQVTALAAAWWLRGNEKREAMNYEKDEDPLMEQILIPSGFVPLSDLNLPDPVVQVTPNGN